MTLEGTASEPKRRATAIRVVLVAILLLSAFIQFTVVSNTVVDNPLRADARTYFSYAYNLKNFGVYSNTATWMDEAFTGKPAPDALATPGYPLFLFVAGNPQPTEKFVRRVTLIQAALGVLSVWLLYLISARFLGYAWALAAAALTAISPHLAVMSTYLLTESLFIFLLFASILSSLIAIESRRRTAIVTAGILWGLCSLVRPTAQFFPIIVLVLVVAIPRLRQYWRACLLAVACFLAVQAPWQIRNRLLPHAPAQPSLMVNFLNFGSYPNFMYEGIPESYGIPYRFDPNINEIQRDLPSFFESLATRFRQHPVEYSRWYLIGKPGYFLSWTNIDGAGDVLVYPVVHSPYLEDLRFALLRMLMLLLHWPLMLLGLLGALVACFRPRWTGMTRSMHIAAIAVTAVFAYALAFHMVGAPLPRYGIPFKPLLYCLALVPLRGVWQAWQRHRSRETI